MARKNNPREEGSIHFDTRTRTVMAEFKQDNIKEKLKAVREVVPGKKRDELVMVLQYFEYNVEKTIQAYLEDGAKKVLNEWSHTQTTRKGKGRQKERPDPKAKEAAAKKPAINGTSEIANNHIDNDTHADSSSSNIPNGHVPHDSPENGHSEADLANILPSSVSSTSSASKTDLQQSHPQQQRQQNRGDRGRGKGHRESHSAHHNLVKQHHQRERTISERSNASSVYGGEHGSHGLDKSFKDLQRQTTSLERLKHLLDSEIDRSSKAVKKVFEEIRKGLDEREANIMAELDVVKKEASDMVNSRYSKGMDLKRMVERAERMKEGEIADVRSQIKHFVTDRRHDEELGRTTRFMYDSDHLLKEVQTFGEVIHIPKVVSRPVSAAPISHSNTSGDSPSHNGVTDIEDRLKHSLHIRDSQSHQTTATPNGPRNKGSNDRRARGAKSPHSKKSNTTPTTTTSSSTSTSPPPPRPSSSTTVPPASSSSPQPQSQRPQQQRQRRPRNDRGGGSSSNNADGSNNDTDKVNISNDKAAVTTPRGGRGSSSGNNATSSSNKDTDKVSSSGNNDKAAVASQTPRGDGNQNRTSSSNRGGGSSGGASNRGRGERGGRRGGGNRGNNNNNKQQQQSLSSPAMASSDIGGKPNHNSGSSGSNSNTPQAVAAQTS